MAKGLKKCQDKIFKFPNYIRIRLLIRIIRAESTRSEFAQACLFSLLFSFRVPSETLQIRMAFRNDRLTEFPPHPEKALVGVRRVGGYDFLAAKFPYRGDLTCGVIPKRPFFCPLGSENARPPARFTLCGRP